MEINKVYRGEGKIINISNIRVGNGLRIEYLSGWNSSKPRKFIGICIGKGNKKELSWILVRGIVEGLGVEKRFLVNSGNILKIEKVTITKKVGKRGKMYYLRHKPMSWCIPK